MTIQEAWNRGNNLVATAVAALAGIAFLPEAFVENEFHFKLDDIELFFVGIVAFLWYVKGKNKYKYSIYPMIFVTISFLVKLGGFFMEMKDKEDVGDDIGGVILFTLATIFVWYVYKMAPKIIQKVTK